MAPEQEATAATYRLFEAPDNASLVVRIVLEELGVPYETQRVDRAVREQESAAYRALNPKGLIPVLIVDGEAVFETAAIILTLAERHGALAPPPGHPGRPGLLKWLFFVSNTVHADCRLAFYSDKYIGPDEEDRRRFLALTQARIRRDFGILDEALESGRGPYLFGTEPTVADIYAGACLRWAQLYPREGEGRVKAAVFPRLLRMVGQLEARPAVVRACHADGLEAPFFTAPGYPSGDRAGRVAPA